MGTSLLGQSSRLAIVRLCISCAAVLAIGIDSDVVGGAPLARSSSRPRSQQLLCRRRAPVAVAIAHAWNQQYRNSVLEHRPRSRGMAQSTAFKRSEVNLTKLEETEGVIALASQWIELDSPDEACVSIASWRYDKSSPTPLTSASRTSSFLHRRRIPLVDLSCRLCSRDQLLPGQRQRRDGAGRLVDDHYDPTADLFTSSAQQDPLASEWGKHGYGLTASTTAGSTASASSQHLTQAQPHRRLCCEPRMIGPGRRGSRSDSSARTTHVCRLHWISPTRCLALASWLAGWPSPSVCSGCQAHRTSPTQRFSGPVESISGFSSVPCSRRIPPSCSAASRAHHPHIHEVVR